MASSKPANKAAMLNITELRENLESVQDQILTCVAKAAHYIKHVELLDQKVQELAIEEGKLKLMLDKLEEFSGSPH